MTQQSAMNRLEHDGRHLLHHRNIHFNCYAREDGLYEVVATLNDITPIATEMPFSTVEAGQSIHDLEVVAVMDAELQLLEVRAQTHSGATPWCKDIAPAYASLTGLRIGPGFTVALRQKVGASAGCTHLTELMEGVAKAAMQMSFSARRKTQPKRAVATTVSEHEGGSVTPSKSTTERPWIIGTCHAYRDDGEAAQILWPQSRPRDR